MHPWFIKLPPLTDAQVAAGARPGEDWEQARERLEAPRYALPPVHRDVKPWVWDEYAVSVAELPLSDGQVAALAAPGEDWTAGRSRAVRLRRCVVECLPCPVCNPTGVQQWGGWIDRPNEGCGTCELRSRSYRKPPHSF